MSFKNLWIPIVCTVALASLGFGWDMLGYTNPLFGWLLIVLAMLIFSATAWHQRRHLFPWVFGKVSSVPRLQSKDIEVIDALFWIADHSAWMRWMDAQHLAHNGKKHSEMEKLVYAEHVLRHRAEQGELEIRGRRENAILYESISADFWKVVFLDIQPDLRRLWKITIKPRDGLSPKAIEQIPEYASLQVDETKVKELWPEKIPSLDRETKKLLKLADKKSRKRDDPYLMPVDGKQSKPVLPLTVFQEQELDWLETVEVFIQEGVRIKHCADEFRYYHLQHQKWRDSYWSWNRKFLSAVGKHYGPEKQRWVMDYRADKEKIPEKDSDGMQNFIANDAWRLEGELEWLRGEREKLKTRR